MNVQQDDQDLSYDPFDEQRRRSMLGGMIGSPNVYGDQGAPGDDGPTPTPSPSPLPPSAPPPVSTGPTIDITPVGPKPTNPGGMQLPYFTPPPGGPGPIDDSGHQTPFPDPKAAPTPTPPPPTGARTDAAYIRSVVQGWLTGNNPQKHADAEYWVNRILQTGGLGQDNMAYWQGRFTEAPGTHVEGPGPTGGTPPPGGPTNPGIPTGTGTLPKEIADYYTHLDAYLQQQQQQQAQIQAAQRDAILRLMQQGEQPVDVRNDKTLGPAADAYSLSRRQGQAQDRASMAERAAFEGLNLGGQGSGSFDSAIQGSAERASQDISGYNANLAVNELQARRSMMMQALQMADAMGARNESAQINTALSKIDAAINEQKIALGYYNQDSANNNFGDQNAFNYADLLYRANRDSTLAGLGK